MPQLPPLTTVLVENVPENWLLGIDLQFFNTTPGFRGIKLVPDGVHVLHWSPNQESIRTGIVFTASANTLVVARWNKQEEKMEVEGEGVEELDVSAMRSRLGDCYQWMVSFPETPGWNTLVDCCGEVVNQMPTFISTSSGTKEENDGLRTLLDNNVTSAEPDELLFTPVAKRTWPDGAQGREITEYTLDKSWYLNQFPASRAFGELQLAFILAVTLANYSCGQHYTKLLELFLNCDKDVDDHPTRFKRLFSLVEQQLSVCPEDFLSMCVDTERLSVAFGEFATQHPIPSSLLSLLPSIGIVPVTDDDEPVIV